MFGSTLAAIFNAPKYHCALKSTRGNPEFAVTRLQSPSDLLRRPRYPRDDALLVCVALTPTAVNQWRAIYGGREVGDVEINRVCATTVLDLRCSLEMWVRGPFDYLHYYVADSLSAMRRR